MNTDVQIRVCRSISWWRWYLEIDGDETTGTAETEDGAWADVLAARRATNPESPKRVGEGWKAERDRLLEAVGAWLSPLSLHRPSSAAPADVWCVCGRKLPCPAERLRAVHAEITGSEK